MIKIALSSEILRKYRVKYLEKQQKNGKIYFFSEKNLLQAHFCTEKQIFFVSLQPKIAGKT